MFRTMDVAEYAKTQCSNGDDKNWSTKGVQRVPVDAQNSGCVWLVQLKPSAAWRNRAAECILASQENIHERSDSRVGRS